MPVSVWQSVAKGQDVIALSSFMTIISHRYVRLFPNLFLLLSHSLLLAERKRGSGREQVELRLGEESINEDK